MNIKEDNKIGYKKLIVWEKADDLAFKIYQITKHFPSDEKFGLVSQMRRAALSVAANIVEGYTRHSKKDKLHFYNIAFGSLTEIEYFIDFSLRFKYLGNDQYKELVILREEVGRLLNGFIKSTENKWHNFQIVLLMLVPCFLLLVSVMPASAARLYFEPQESFIGYKGDFWLAINIEAEDSINAAEIGVYIPKNIQLYDANEGGSIINLWTVKPVFDETSRLLTFAGIIPGGFANNKATLLLLKVKAIGNGNALFSFDKSKTIIYLNTPNGIKDDLILENVKLSIAPGKENIAVGTFDYDVPESFVPEIARDNNIFGGKWFLVFTTQDKGSGIDHYEIQENRKEKMEVGRWRQIESPYLLEDQELRSYIYLMAIDKAGNQRLIKMMPKNPLELYTNYWLWGIILLIVICVYYFGFKIKIWQRVLRQRLYKRQETSDKRQEIYDSGK